MWNGSGWQALAATLPISETDYLYLGDLLERELNLYFTADGRYYDPWLGKYLQPDPIGGPPLIPQAADRYQVAGNSPTGVGYAGGGTPGWAFAEDVAIEIGKGVLGSVVESLGRVTARPFIRGTKTAMYRAVCGQANAGVRAALGPGATGWVRGARQTPNAVLGLARGQQFELVGASRSIRPDEFDGLLRGNFSGAELDWVREYRGWRGFLASPLGEFSTSIAIDALIDLPFFYVEVWTNPYLSLEQKEWRFVIMAGGWVTGGIVGLCVGGIPGLVVGVGVGLAYEYIFVPLIRPAITQVSGTDPYDETLKLRPLE